MGNAKKQKTPFHNMTEQRQCKTCRHQDEQNHFSQHNLKNNKEEHILTLKSKPSPERRYDKGTTNCKGKHNK